MQCRAGGGIESPGGDNSGGSLQSDRILADILGNTVEFSFNGDGLEMPATPSYEWSFGDSSEISTISNPTHIYANTGTYTVTVTVTGQTSEGKEITHKVDREIEITDISTEASNSYLYAEKSKNNPLQYSFYTPMVFSGVSPDDITYNWQPDNTVVEEDGTTKSNVYDHTYTKYGKQYTAQVIAKTGTGLESKATVNINIPNPEIDLICTTQGLTVTCIPEITLDGEKVDIPMDFEWDCGNNDGSFTKTSGTEPNTCTYTDDGENKKTITVTGESDNIEGSITGEETVSVSSILNVGQVVCNMAGQPDHLTWKCDINTTISAEGQGGTLQYRWHFGEKDGKWTEWEQAEPGTHSKTHTYAKYRNDSSSDYNVQVEVRYDANNGEAVQTSETVDTTEYSEQGSSSTKIRIDAPVVELKNEAASGNNFERTFTAILNYTPKGNLTYMWNFGDGDTAQTNTNIVEHSYKSEGNRNVTVRVLSAENPKVFSDGYIETAESNLSINGSIDVSNANIQTIQNPNNPLEWDFRVDGVTTTTGNIVYQWQKERVNIEGANGQELNNQIFDKFGKSYSVSVEVSIEGTDVKDIVETTIRIEQPVVTINPPGTIVTGKDVTFTNSIKYGNVDVKSMLQGTSYSWNIDKDPKTEEEPVKNWRNPENNKIAKLTVTASNVEGDMVADPLTFSVLPAEELGSFEASCNEAGLSDYDTIRWECTAKAMNTKGGEMTLDDPKKYTYSWSTNPSVSDGQGVATTYNKDTATLILDWPTDKKANVKAEQDYTITLVIKDTASNSVLETQTFPAKVVRKVVYTGRVRGNGGNGENIQNIIDITGLEGPSNTSDYKWVLQLNTRNNGMSKFEEGNPFTTGSISNMNLEAEVQERGFVSKVVGNPFEGTNGIGLYIPKGNQLSRDLRIYGLADNNQILGPSITWCTNSHTSHAITYEGVAQQQQQNVKWGREQSGSFSKSNLIYLWQSGNIQAKKKISKEDGAFAKITVVNDNGGTKSLKSAGLKVSGELKTINDTIELSTTNKITTDLGLAFYTYGVPTGNVNVLLKVKDTSNGSLFGTWHNYGVCPTAYKANWF